MKLNILVLGDIVGQPGRAIVENRLPALIKEKNIDFAIANAENAADGSGITPDVVKGLFASGLDAITTGDHVWRKKEAIQVLETDTRVLRPANYSPLAKGRGWVVIKNHLQPDIAVINLLGRVYMSPIDCPFRVVDRILEDVSRKTQIIIVDIHAEATSEKVAMGWYLDGRVSAVVGTHTHVQTADERVLPGSTAYITDLGMTGPYHSVLGRNKDHVLKFMVTQMPTRFEVAEKDVRMSGAIITVDASTGKALGIERLVVCENNGI
ncbi:MAG: metallophosphoesterase [Planctomycetes bacterium GWA2_50_13]|nr:MAG: metallophosphoesterase [Planctomycetes bacterium GWA2_50_13]OHB92673.1 MAG: metallophosphoesterase [Planctomycetes bacterium RIFCSPHIGHO2_12_FULL_51_37]OHB95714.1 MAG: metallophosphoesterase [Planctomycetes bacterium RIFCSPLOWO2_02_FULL_50_16]OHC02962.1 MAG: metallophosphoesterase [Planctomycetes bacterium RIFCSPLOWO2_12_FULL_50_35]HCN20387.1 TIGR00282 family metallophosphoesterase [Planctomycetia bacterium]